MTGVLGHCAGQAGVVVGTLRGVKLARSVATPLASLIIGQRLISKDDHRCYDWDLTRQCAA